MHDKHVAAPAGSQQAARQVSRRNVTRGAVALAWAIPAVQLAAAAPAFAASDVAVPERTGLSTSGGSRLTVTVPLAFQAGRFPLGSTLTLVIKTPGKTPGPADALTPTAGWSIDSGWATTGNPDEFTRTFTTTSESPAVPFVAQVDLRSGGQNYVRSITTVTVLVQPKGRPAATHVISWPPTA